ncbi:MAG TPA: GNAT family N-acetyltransferase [Pedococcus sp.]|jgi:GNAT superfamily N-acetyltransferase|nr:GNAT family N-acetyltransferase [Pedococcus sp.]
MQIRRLNADDVEEFNAFHAVLEQAERFERPYAGVWSLEEARIIFTDDDPGERIDAFVAVDRGEIAVDRDEVIGAGAAFSGIQDNLHLSYVSAWVPPQRRRQGIGSAILAELVACCRTDGRTDIAMETAYPFEHQDDHPYRRFAEKHGFVLANREVARVLDLPVDETLLAALAGEARAAHGGYRIETFEGVIPEPLVAGLCAVRNQLAVDAPTGLLDFEPEAITPAVLRFREDALRRQGRTLLSTLALTEDDHVVVGYSDLVIPAGDLPNVHQWGTLVLRRHRGHRLGLAMKAHALQELQRRVGPERTRVLTCNAEQNASMVAINERLGFRPVENVPAFLLRLPSERGVRAAGPRRHVGLATTSG